MYCPLIVDRAWPVSYTHLVEFTREMKKDYTILVPNMLPVHFGFLLKVFEEYGYNLKILQNDGQAVVDAGLKYVHNDTCYPALLVIGQFMDALHSGVYDLNKTALLITQTGGGCRASNYIHLLRKALKKAGLDLSLIHISTLSVPLIFAIGNAPTALLRLDELVREGTVRPRLIIGVPVGFVNVVQSKERIMNAGVPCICLLYTSCSWLNQPLRWSTKSPAFRHCNRYPCALAWRWTRLSVFITVSYSHLDVYKRQIHCLPKQRFPVERKRPYSHKRTTAGTVPSIPVSYTHLDVYKRQSQAPFFPRRTDYTFRLPSSWSYIPTAQCHSKRSLLCLLYTSRCV